MYSSRFVAIWPPSPGTGERSIPYYSAASDRDARSELDHTLRQQLEVLRSRRTVALHPAEELAPPGQEARAGGAGDGGPAEEERGLHRLEAQAVALEELESARHVGLFHETVGDQGLIEATALDYAHLGALAIGEAGHLRVDDREENDPLMQDLVVLQVVQEHRRHRAAIGRQIDRGPLYTRHVGTEHRSKRFDRNADLSFPGHYDAFGALPGREHRENHHAAGEREPAAFGELHGIGCEEHQLDERDRCD